MAWIVLLAIIIWGAILRFYCLGDQSVWNDESFSIAIAQGIFDTGLPEVPSGEIMWRGIFSHNWMAFTMPFVDDPILACRIPSAIFGTLTIPLVFFFARRVSHSNFVGLVAAALVAFLMVEVAWSRQARMYADLQFFYILAMYVFYQYLGSLKQRDLILALLIAIMAILCHQIAISLIVAFLVCGIVTKNKDWLLYFLTGAILTAVAFAFVFELVQWTGIDLGAHSYYYFEHLIVLFPVIAAFAVVGAGRLIERDWRTPWRGYSILLMSTPLILLAMLSCLDHGAGGRYIYCTLPIFFILFAWYARVVWQAWKARIVRMFVFAVIVAVVIIPTEFAVTRQATYYDFDASIHQPDFKTAYAYVAEHRGPDDFIVDAWPTVGLLYLDEMPGYHIYPLDFPLADPSKERYTGIPSIQNVASLEMVVGSHEFGWVIMDEYGWKRQDPEIVEWVEHNMTLQDCPAEGMVIYHWQWLE